MEVKMKRQGEFIKNLSGDSTYYSFRPSNLPPFPGISYDDDLIKLLADANRALGKLDGISMEIPNKELFISMYIRKEALMSSQIEGTQATIDDIFDPSIDKNINLDVTEVINYIKANRYADEQIKKLPISNRFIRNIHQVLLSEGRGSDNTPGEFRRSQNWIGPKGSSLQDARYIPPNTIDMNDLMSSLEQYIHEVDSLDKLIKIALIHYQFETIHPFVDGNGRIGRLLINILLKEYNLLRYDTLYLSYFFKKNRIEYYDRLMDIRLKGHYEQWIKFFLSGIIETSYNAITCINQLVELREKNLKLIASNVGRSRSTVLRLFSFIEDSPILDVGTTSRKLKMAFNTTANAIAELENLGILVQANRQSRNRVFIYEKYLSILREGTE